MIARLTQRLFNKLANLLAHARHNAVAHFDHKHARLAIQRATLERIVQQVGHLG